METKPWYESKTVWLNALAILVAVGYYLLDQPGVVPAQYLVYATAIIGALNLVLRMLTTQPIELRKKPSDEGG